VIVVTGGAGFIGSNIVRGLNQSGRTNILIVDRLSDLGQHKNLNCLKFSDYVDKADFLDRFEDFGPIEAIFHQGACSSTVETDSLYMMENNYQYSKRLLHLALKRKIPFLYASSASVYGNGERGFSERIESEYPLNIYAFSKALFDRYVSRILPESESQVLGLRYFNVYGAQENHKGQMASVAHHFVNQLFDTNNMKLFAGSENFCRDFIYVDDVVKVNLFFLEHGNSGIFNCGTGVTESFHEIAIQLKKINLGGDIEFIPFPEHLVGKYQEFTQADITSLRDAGYAEKFLSLQDGLSNYFQHMKTNEGYFRD
jgi:ADP-L-glycero-D-manno-heptose 6-epimerase